MMVVPDVISKPNIIIPDIVPLIHLMQAGQLPLLHHIGSVVALVDVVVDEAGRGLSVSDAAILGQWIAAGLKTGSTHPVRVQQTEIGQALVLARRVEPAFLAPRAGEVAITEWLVAAIQGTTRPAIVLAENSRVSGIVANQAVDADIKVVTTRALLALAEGQGLLASAEAIWKVMLDRAAVTVSPARHARPSQEQLDEAARLTEAEVAARSPEQEAAITEALRDHGIE